MPANHLPVLIGLLAMQLGIHRATAAEPVTLETSGPVPAIDAKEPLASTLSLEKTAEYMDRSALAWQKTHQCGACHTNFAHLMARPALDGLASSTPTVRQFFETMVTDRWEDLGPRWDAEVVVAAAMLAINDAKTTGKLHPITEKALSRMWALQRDDGGWDWLDCGWPPMEFDDHYGVTLAAIGVGSAPGGYVATPAAQKGLEGIRRFLRDNPPPSLHHEAMNLWASTKVDGILSADLQQATLAKLLAAKRSDGGWALGQLLKGWEAHQRKDDLPQETSTSDAYATGLVIYVARQAGVPATDERLASGLAWLKSNQRESGRWYTPSPTKDSKHYIANAGTAFAVMALESCDAIPKRVALLRQGK